MAARFFEGRPTNLSIGSILHPTDFSVQVETAFQLSCALARDYGAKPVSLNMWVRAPAAYPGSIPRSPWKWCNSFATRSDAGVSVENTQYPASSIALM